MATKRKATKRKSKKATKAQKAAQNQLLSVLLFTVGLLFTFLALVKGDALWKGCHNVLLGLFGPAAFLVGPVFVYIAVMASFERMAEDLSIRAFLTTVTLFMLSAAAQIFLAGPPLAQTAFGVMRELYMQGQLLKGGGLCAMIFGVLLMKLGTPGDAIVVCLLLFALFMIITKSTLAGLLRAAKRPVDKLADGYQELVASMPAAREQKEERLARESARHTTIDISLGEGTPVAPKEKPITAKAKANLLQKAAEIEMTEHEQVRPQTIPTATVSVPTEPVKTDAGQTETVCPPFVEGGSAQAEDINIDLADAFPMEETPDRLGIADILKRVEASNQPVESAIATAVEESPCDGEGVRPDLPDAIEEDPNDQQAEPLPLPEPIPLPDPPEYVIPPVALLQEPKVGGEVVSSDELRQNAERLVDTLQSFGVQTRIVDISRGPAVTRYELQPSAGVKISKITNLADDIALNLAAAGVRIEAPIPNKAAVGIEIPNKVVSPVTLREIIDSEKFSQMASRVSVALGRDVSGNVMVADIAKMPHLLIAGATGSGKSVCINSIIMSLLYKARPDQVKLMLVDPKVVELGVYNGLPHLVVPVVNDAKKAAGVLGWAVSEMLHRYQLFAQHSTRDITGFNRLCDGREELERLPHIVIVVDELADLMMAAPTEVEDHICRLAQMARAAGMHLIIATQRPSVDVITGIIKANIPSRIAFAVSSQVDSRTILDMGGAEKLLGMGDMLFYPVGASKPVRVQGCYVSDDEIERVVSFIKGAQAPVYDQGVIEEIERHTPADKRSGGSSSSSSNDGGEEDEMLQSAIECVVEAGIASTSLLQRKCKLGYARAARIIDELEERGIVGPFEGSKPRQVLISRERWIEMKLNQNK